MFFVSSSDDKTVKVWDTARLERNVTSKPRHTYGQHHARVKCVCMLESVHCFASAAEDGSLHVVRVLVSQTGTLPKYNKLQVVREHRLDNPGEYVTCMTHYNTGMSSSVHARRCRLNSVVRHIIQPYVCDESQFDMCHGLEDDAHPADHGEPTPARPCHMLMHRSQTSLDSGRHNVRSVDFVGPSVWHIVKELEGWESF